MGGKVLGYQDFQRGFLVVATICLAVVCPPANADEAIERGKRAFKACASCHQVGPDARNTVGPALNGIFGRRAGSIEGVRYSDDLLRSGANGLVWNHDNLDKYIENPRSLISKTRMQFRGIKDAGVRADILAYLRQFSDDPSDIPEAARTATAASHDPAIDPSILAIQGDPEFGEYLAGECVSCHQPSGADSGIPSIVGWPADAFVTAMHAYRAKVRSHPVMQMIAGPLNDEEIASLAAYFETLEP